MKDLFGNTRLYEPELTIPLIVAGIIFGVAGIYYLIKYIKKKESRYVRNTALAGALFIVTGVCFGLCNLIMMVAPVAIYQIVPRILRLNKKANPDDKRNLCFPWPLKKTKKRVVANIFLIVAMLLVFIPYYAAGYTYQVFFGVHYQTNEQHMFRVADFEGLQCENVTFQNDKGQNLAGYLYYYDDGMPKKGVVVLGHGFGGGGQNGYMPCMNYFAKHGYYGFAYDATGNDNSDGYGIVGLPQQISDMDKAITYVENDERMKSLPIMLFGHSWGGYTVTNELSKHPEVKAVVANAGFNYSLDLIKSWGPGYVGPFTNYFVPYMKLIEKMKLGQLSDSTADKAFAASDAKIMLIAAENDQVVPVKYGFDYWKNKYANDPRFRFVARTGLEDNVAHGYVYCSKEYLEWRKTVRSEEYDAWLASLTYDYNDSKNQEQFEKDKYDFYNRPDIRQHNANQLDEQLFTEILEFYNSAID